MRSSLATLAGLLFNYLLFYSLSTPLWTETIAEWIMARTPSRWAVPLLDALGAWAKPLAVTGGLAAMGFAVLLVSLLPRKWMAAGAVAASLAFAFLFDYRSVLGIAGFWVAALLVLLWPRRFNAALPTGTLTRRQAFVMVGGTAAVAVESFARNRSLAGRALRPVPLAPFPPVALRDGFGAGLSRKRITPVNEFYGMSKNTVDPVIDPKTWRLRITQDGRPIREFSYDELLSLPRTGRFVTLRCISNTLQSDLMGTAHWSGVFLHQLIDHAQLPGDIRELAVIGVDGHGDSFSLDYAFSNETILALGMNGETLDRTHGFPIRLLVPRYYGLKNVKWISELAFVSQPYIGTWPKLGYTKEPVIHTASHIDRYEVRDGLIRCGGVSFAGGRGVRAVQVRADSGPWVHAVLEPALSEYCWTRWIAELPAAGAKLLEARAQDGTGAWQSNVETPLFPNGVDGPTMRRVSS